jgi:hypothetical protein
LEKTGHLYFGPTSENAAYSSYTPHTWPGGISTRWTTDEISWSQRRSSNPNRSAELGRTMMLIRLETGSVSCTKVYSGIRAGEAGRPRLTAEEA